MEKYAGYLVKFKTNNLQRAIFCVKTIKHTCICPFDKKKHKKNKSETSDTALLKEMGGNG